MGHITKQLEIHPQYRVLKNQLRTYENYLIRHQSILSPLRRFPPELLCYIFEFFAPSRSYINTPDNHSRWSELPWSLSQVCHRWRGISLSMPLLWTKIPLLVPLMRHTIDPSFLQFYTGFLLRSADQPIDVFVTVSSYGDKIYTEIKWHPAIAILVSHSYRWQHLSIVSRSSTHVLRAFRRIKKRLSTLRTLSLELNREAYLDIFQKAPKLLQVRLIGISPERITLPWKQLVHYKGMYDQADATIPLHSGRSLETLELQRYSYVGSLERVQSLPIVLHNLVGLKLCKISEDVTTHLLRRLIIPVIEEIAIFDVADPDRDFDDPIPLTPLLTSMISCSTTACVLQRLSLGESSYHPGELIALLRLTPCLVFFDVKFPPLDDLVHLSVIDSIGGSSLIVPLLHTLVITSDWSYKDHTTAAVMNQLARKRCRETIGPPINTGASEPPHLLQTSFTVPLRIFRMDFPTGVSRFEAQGVLNGWPCETCEHCLEERLFVDWGSELQTLFPHLIPRGVTFIPSDSFKKSMELLTSVQKIMAFNKAMLNHKLQEVKHLFVCLMRSFSCSDYLFRTDKMIPLARNSGCCYTSTTFLIYALLVLS